MKLLSSDRMLSLSEAARLLNIPYTRADKHVKAERWQPNAVGPGGLLLFAESRLAQLREIDAANPAQRGNPGKPKSAEDGPTLRLADALAEGEPLSAA